MRCEYDYFGGGDDDVNDDLLAVAEAGVVPVRNGREQLWVG